MKKQVLAELIALKSMTAADLKRRWGELFDGPPPPYNRRFLESRLAYRLQELAHGGLSQATAERLDALADGRGAGRGAGAKAVRNAKPLAGTRLIREWRGVEHTVTVRDDGYEWQGRPYKSLSSIAREIAGTRWNGWIFFGLKAQGGARA